MSEYKLPVLADIERAASLVSLLMPPTPQYRWPLLDQRCGTEVWVKHENHTPVGAFKIRGGLVYMNDFTRSSEATEGVVSATRGNHGQSVAFAAKRHGLKAAIVVPHGNSVEKNAAMRALGAELIEHGRDFQESAERADEVAAERGWHRMPTFHPLLVQGVATYALEFLSAVHDLDVVYVPIGMGSGICGMMAVRDALRLDTKIIGVVSEGAPTMALSFKKGEPVPHEVTTILADGMAVRVPHAGALSAILKGVERIVEVSDDEIAAAMRALFADTHNVAEGAGAAGLAALLKEGGGMAGQRVGIILSGGNVDSNVLAKVLSR